MTSPKSSVFKTGLGCRKALHFTILVLLITFLTMPLTAEDKNGPNTSSKKLPEVKEDDSIHEPLQWMFPSTVIKDLVGRQAKIGDPCFYPAWVKHAQPILEAMKHYNKAKRNYRKQYAKAVRKGRTKAPNAEEYIKELADKIAVARMASSANVKAQLKSSNRKFPYDIRESRSNNSNLMKLLCEGGDLLQCKQLGRTEFGVCRCFDLEDGEPMYSTHPEDGHCRGVSGSTCNGEDPVISTVCLDKLACVNFSQAACEFEYGDKFHCSGYPKGVVGKQNLFCSRRTYHPEHANDFEGFDKFANKCGSTAFQLVLGLTLCCFSLLPFLPNLNIV
jgi:hypothetical protein